MKMYTLIYLFFIKRGLSLRSFSYLREDLLEGDWDLFEGELSLLGDIPAAYFGGEFSPEVCALGFWEFLPY